MKPLINHSHVLQSCLEIHCGSDQGTGFVISRNVILTAFHVIADYVDDQKIFIQRSEGKVECKVVATSIDLDLCLLSCDVDDLDSLPLEASILRLREPCQIYGFPYASRQLGVSLNGKISQSINDDASDFIINELDIDPKFDHEGLSGAPVIIEGKVAGIVRRQLDERLSIVSVLKASKFLGSNGVEFDENLPAYHIPHGFEEQIATSRPNRAVITRLEEALETDSSWFLLYGSPGSGKSTLSASFSPRLKTTIVACRYFLKIPNDNEPLALRRSKLFFLEYLENVISTTITGQRLPKDELSFEQRLLRMKNLLEEFAAYHLAKKLTVCIIIDGLDEVPLLEEFLGVLPTSVPKGIKILLSATSPQILPSHYKNLIAAEQQILVTPLSMSQCEGLIIEELRQDLISVEEVQALAEKSEGHPLYLRYLINFLKNCEPDFFDEKFDEWLKKIPIIQGDITNYYDSLWDRFYENPSKLWIIIIFSQVRQPISTDEAYQILPESLKLTFTSNFDSIKYLFSGENYLEIYHNSFKIYAVSKTKREEPLANDYISSFLASELELDLSLNNLLYHYSKSSKKSFAVQQCNQTWADRCAMNDVAPDLVLDDIKQVIRLSIELKLTLDTIRLLLLLQRIDFRYDSIFTEHANLLAFSLISIGKYDAAIKYLVRDADLLIGNYDAVNFLQLFYENKAIDEANILYESLEKRYRKFIEEGIRSNDGMNVDMFEVIIRANALSISDNPKTGFQRCMGILAMLKNVEDGARKANENEGADDIYALRELGSGWINAYALRSIDYFVPSKMVHEKMKIDIDDGWANIRALSILFFDEFNDYNNIIVDKNEHFKLLVKDLEVLVRDYGYKQEHAKNIILALLNNSSDCDLLRTLILKNKTTENEEFNLRAPNGVDLQFDEIYNLLFRSICEGYTDETENFVPLRSLTNRYKNWENYSSSILQSLGYIEGRLLWCRAVDSNFASAEEELLRVFEAINFSLDERSKWDRAYHLPEYLFPIIYSKCFEISVKLLPEVFQRLFDFFISRMSRLQLGLYSEGFRRTLYEVCKILIKKDFGNALEELLKIWESHIIENVYNRWERTPELLKIMEIYGLAGNSNKAKAVFQEMLKTSMGPSWYKEDQLALIGRVMSLPDKGSVVLSALKTLAGLLDFASGEMTFQRYVRQEKEHFIGGLIRNDKLKNALDYYKFEILPDASQVIKNAEYDEIDTPIPGNGYVLGAGGLTEERAILEILENSQIKSRQLVWAMSQIFIINTDTERYLNRFTTIQSNALQSIIQTDTVSVKFLLPFIASNAVKLHAQGHANYYLKSIFDELNQSNRLELQSLLKVYGIEYNIDKKEPQKIENSYSKDKPGNPVTEFLMEASSLKELSDERERLLNTGTNAFMSKKYMIWHGNYSSENSEARRVIKGLIDSAEEGMSILKPFIEEFDEIPWVVVSQLLWFLQDKFSAEQTHKIYDLVSEHFTELIQPHQKRIEKYSWIENTSNDEEDPDIQVASFLIWLLNHPVDRISEAAYNCITLLCNTDPKLIVPVLIKQSLSGKPIYSTERASFILLETAASQPAALSSCLDKIDIQEFTTIGHFTIRYNFFRIAAILKDFVKSELYNEIRKSFPEVVAPTAEVDIDEVFLESIEWNISRLNEKNLLDNFFCETLISTINQCIAPLSINEFIKSDDYVNRSFYESTNGPTRFEYVVKHSLNIAINHRVSLCNMDEIFDEIDI
ncbi:S1 family peptidase [Flavobacterium sp. KACC 22763]|uniref:S1 family peptidase n=1 Tax=Flavobacterium sp. KACC 22763 TaxID=3025668 RepID=UPI002365AB67|nr:serine protease [Flavobacterium sp. KACC 22763]WDF66122.1 trypsin-like peptidase domain-containing protein [Flavobacterium sp. KACC 22763]